MLKKPVFVPATPIKAGDSRVDLVLAKLIPVFERMATRLLPHALIRPTSEFLVFGIKQAWACLFGGLMLAAIMVSAWVWPEQTRFARYDALFIFAISVQAIFLLTKLERPREAWVIFAFHLVGTMMEVFKTAQGSWAYPELSVLRLGGVPLFSGFMYAAVGSYLARAIRVFDMQFTHYPRRRWTVLLGVLIYLNFFTHHYIYDFRWVLMAASVALFFPARVGYRVWRWHHKMPLVLGFVLIALFLWLAENIGTLTGTWLYPDQQTTWKMVSFSKMSAWYLLMIISWVLVTLIHPPRKST